MPRLPVPFTQSNQMLPQLCSLTFDQLVISNVCLFLSAVSPRQLLLWWHKHLFGLIKGLKFELVLVFIHLFTVVESNQMCFREKSFRETSAECFGWSLGGLDPHFFHFAFYNLPRRDIYKNPSERFLPRRTGNFQQLTFRHPRAWFV